MKKFKPINFSGHSIFTAIFTSIVLYVLLVLMLSAFVLVTKLSYLPYIIVNLIFIVSIYILERKNLKKMLLSFKDDVKKHYKNILIISGSLLVFEVILNAILIKVVGHNPTNNQMIVDSFTGNNIVLILIYTIIVCPTLEALMYFYPYKNVKNKKLGFAISSIIFALTHMTSCASLMDLLFFIPYLSMSFAFNYGFYKTNNLTVSIVIHSLNNLIAFVLLLIM